MSLCVVAGAVVVRLPQIAKVIRTKNVHGIAESGLLLDFTSCAAFLSYNRLTGQPLLTYGETFFLFVQSLAQLLLYWQFSSNEESGGKSPRARRVGLSLAFVALSVFAYSPFFPHPLLLLLGVLPAPLLVSSRLPQIIQNSKQGHTGQLSLLTAAMTCGGNLARLVTTWISVNDSLVLLTNLSSTTANAVLLAQILMYRSQTKTEMARVMAKRES
eukprot:GHVU01054016.1.p1 GENE.GHVU01054016.1~~GHVU01054016.1.p1  ORF type:complete len:215 (+),score=40.79 GHVU01054016.1:134-778(+)